MRDIIILIIAILVLVGLLFYRTGIPAMINPIFDVPSGVKGVEGLEYIRNNYASGLEQAKSLCTGQFKGTWRDDSRNIGCYDMETFDLGYCNSDIIQNIVKLCNTISGNPICSSTQASCSV
ncbi:hypothetical protein A3K64_00195 [Candidatus Micrarchaeota archaeon RBG_16_36_9]|nr:MAG: hypothetical protein A3K64_00195 [Candidatus Micrarchaeota archaeon RBG_16_36_9]